MIRSSDFMASRHIRPVKEHEIIYVEQTWRRFQDVVRADFRSCRTLGILLARINRFSNPKEILTSRRDFMWKESSLHHFRDKIFHESFL